MTDQNKLLEDILNSLEEDNKTETFNRSKKKYKKRIF